MRTLLRDFRDFFVSLKLTVVLLLLGIVLVFWATLSQADLGVWGVQQKFFHSLFVLQRFGSSDIPVPVFPGGYLIGGFLLVNLVAAHVYRFRFTWKKTGILLAHAGLILLLVGELLSGLLQQDFYMRLPEGETKNYSESHRLVELALTDTSDPKTDEVVVIPDSVLATGEPVQFPKLPFRVVVTSYFPNAAVRPRTAQDPALATHGFGLNFAPIPLPISYSDDQPNVPAATVELIGPSGSLGSWLVTTGIREEGRLQELPPQHFTGPEGHPWKIALRPMRKYHPFSISLLKFSHDVYPGTDIPKNFSSRIRLQTSDGREDREVLIYMNNPLRYGGLTFYQSGYEGEHTTILQVVRNPSWLMPYIACLMIAIGLIVQFGIHLVGFVTKRRPAGSDRPAATAPDPTASAPLAPEPAWTTWVTVVAAVLAVAGIAMSVLPPKNPTAFDTVTFGRLPVLANGRIKPLDTVARSTLLQLQHHATVVQPGQDRRLTPAEWLLDAMFRPEVADTYQVFRIVNSEVLSLFDLKPTDGRDGK